MFILGISAYYHDAAAVLIHNGSILAAAQEERFNRKKHYAGFPSQSINFCLDRAGIKLSEVDHIVFYDKPFLKFERILETYVSFAPKGFRSFVQAMPTWLKEKLFQKTLLRKELLKLDTDYDIKKRLLFSEHHLSHAASAFFPSPFKEALILTMDGVGEWTTTSVMHGVDEKIKPLKEIYFPHSIGLLYSAFTYFCGFKVNSGEYKLMGLAPYGMPKYTDLICKHLIDIRNDGSFQLDMKYFNYCTGLTMTNRHFAKLFGKAPRKSEEPVTQVDMDLAASIQEVTEIIILKMARSLRIEYGIPNLCLAGGVALNCVVNGKLQAEGIFDHVWVQPASGDAGGALGSALAVYYMALESKRQVDDSDSMAGSYLGPDFDSQNIKNRLDATGAKYEELTDDELIDKASQALTDEKVIGWFQGRMEYGPRALGNRSIIGNPMSTDTQKTMNLKIKYRESFRPFAPSVLLEDVKDYFDFNSASPYMLMVAPVTKSRRKSLSEEDMKKEGISLLSIARSDIPAVTHVDFTARIQTVDKKNNLRYHNLISKFKEKTGYGVVVNTSFNVRGEPIVCTPEDAFHCFMGTEMDCLFIGNLVLYKDKQDLELKKDYTNEFELD